jgi:hypothetical protein
VFIEDEDLWSDEVGELKRQRSEGCRSGVCIGSTSENAPASKRPFGSVAWKKTPAFNASFYNYLEYLARIKS